MEANDIHNVDDHEDTQEAPVDIAEPQVKKQKTAHNAFSELMKPRPPTPKKPPSQFKDPHSDLTDLRNARNHLLPYIQAPEEVKPGVVISYSGDFVLIKDAYPKASVHLLLLPRDLKYSTMHPYDALQDTELLDKVKPEVAKAKEIAAAELRRLYGRYSVAEKPRRDALESDDPPEDLPPGRDWSREVIAGIHTHPSMNHMHVHVLSVDRHSECLKHRKHYNSFNTDFFVPVSTFPLSDEERTRRWNMRWHEQDMLCWRCGKNFGNKFARLKEHLEQEFGAWRAQ